MEYVYQDRTGPLVPGDHVLEQDPKKSDGVDLIAGRGEDKQKSWMLKRCHFQYHLLNGPFL
jgi:hypothetical protein